MSAGPRAETAFVTAVGRRLAQLRQAHHLSQGALAAVADVPASYVSAVERGRGADLARLHRLCTALGVTVADVVESVDP